MKPEQLQELKDAITITIQEKVNGKIDRMNTKLDVYISDDMRWKDGVDIYMTEMRPVKDGVHAIQTMNRFVKWLGLPALGALVAYWIAK